MSNITMILAINSKNREEVSIALYKKDKIGKEISWQSKIGQSQKLLRRIDQFLKKNKVKLTDLKAVAVYQGPGSYTSLRIGISVANTLAWTLNIPILGVKNCQTVKLFTSSKVERSNCQDKYNNLTMKQFNNKYNALEIAKQAKETLKLKKLKKLRKIVIPYYDTRLN